MSEDFTNGILGKTGKPVHRLGLSATYRPGKGTIHRAIDEGMNVFFCYGFDTHMTKTFRDLTPEKRDQMVLVTGAYNLIWWYPNLRRTVEKRLRQLRTDHLDVFLFLGVMKEKQFPQKARDELYRLRETGKILAIGLSTHDRRLAGRLAEEGLMDVLMIRYNAAHRGAEQDIFPHLNQHNPGLISYTATRWSYLLRRPRGWPEGGRIPTAGECYRFVLTNPHVDVCFTAPRNLKQLEENLAALRQGPLPEEDMEFMRRFGDAVRHTKKWFM